MSLSFGTRPHSSSLAHKCLHDGRAVAEQLFCWTLLFELVFLSLWTAAFILQRPCCFNKSIKTDLHSDNKALCAPCCCFTAVCSGLLQRSFSLSTHKITGVCLQAGHRESRKKGGGDGLGLLPWPEGFDMFVSIRCPSHPFVSVCWCSSSVSLSVCFSVGLPAETTACGTGPITGPNGWQQQQLANMK